VSSLRVALLIAAKDLRQRFRDRSALIFAIVAPLGLALIFSRLIGPNAAFHATWVVTDLDGGELAMVLRDEVIGGVAKAGVADVTDAPTEEAARAAVANGDVDSAFIIPQGFTAAIQSGRPTTIEVVGSRTSGLATDVARAVAARFGEGVVGVQLAVATVGELSGAPLSAADQARLAEAARAAPPPVAVVEVTTDLRALDLATFFSASMAILFLFFSAQAGLLSVFDERRRGTLRRILAAPVGPGTVIVGKLLGAFAMSVVAMATLVVATTLLIGANWGPPVGVAALIFAAIVAALGVSALVISFAKSEASAGNATAAVGITLAIVGGTFAPSAQAPEAFAALSLFTPHGWFLRGLGDLHGTGGGVATAAPAVLALLAIGIVTGAIGVLRARRLVTP
jgi:ABC-2 type transport system permease protein